MLPQDVTDAIALHPPHQIALLASAPCCLQPCQLYSPAREYFVDSNEGSQRELLLGRRRILKSDIHEVETGFIEETRFLLCISIVVFFR
ncbi:hypothetical protein [Microseira wollei]|uniref:hypothetical protein n=1 Tax=Microseira wollei TaxID=467598 RepID=UPI001CFE809F|nr:hypothetical protein [Microseira wollei]